ncbi:MAG: sulfite exporter TauE/SafE family protein [Porticoccaceae bacterium]
MSFGFSLLGEGIFLTITAFFAASVANATAIGGGFLFMPLFIFIYKLAPAVALKLSIATQAFGMTSGALAWGRKYIDKRAFILASSASILGVWVATYLWVVPSNYIKPLFALISLGVFFALILEMKLKVVDEQQTAKFTLNVISVFFVFSAFAGGLITGWTAIGVGEVVALYLLFFYRLRLDIAIGTGVAVLAVSSIAGLMFHLHLGGIPWELLAFTVPGVILGGRYGAKMAKHIEAEVKQSASRNIIKKSPLKLIFAVVILLDCIVILFSELLA